MSNSGSSGSSISSRDTSASHYRLHHGTASALSGASAGLVASIVTCPLDVVKTRLQAQVGPLHPSSSSSNQGKPPSGAVAIRNGIAAGAPRAGQHLAAVTAATGGSHAAIVAASTALESQYQSIPQIMRRIWIEDGFKGFYRGLGPTIFGYLPTWAIYFSVYDTCKDTLASTLHVNVGNSEFVNHIVAAMAAGAASTVCTSPLWVVKTRFMLQSAADPHGERYRHTGDAFIQIWRAEGWRGFYKGLLPSLFGVSHVAVQFPLYEQFKSWARASRRRARLAREGSDGKRSWNGLLGGGDVASGSGSAASSSAQAGGGGDEAAEDLLPSSTILVCSSTAKMIASVATYPHEVLRTKLQMQPKTSSAAAATGSVPSPAAVAGSPSSSRGFHTLGGSSNGTLPWHHLPPSAHVRRRDAGGGGAGDSANLSSSAHSQQRRPPPLSSSASSSVARGATHAFSALTGHTADAHPAPQGAGRARDVGEGGHAGSNGGGGGGGGGNGGGAGGPGQRRYTGVIQACRTIAREEGIRGFYRGMTVNLVRTVPNSALTILTYELMMRQLTGSSA
ncbi:hypothetical protein OC846_006471 [Tilletia horrida]|uniref:Mitochondrial carrier n=1 Tax=Tilletia horrida TaxID=155126 RepID=A0AAN6GLK7_9BASI|nr:hypothetical protein OC846_006471 [Tilletia horrida]KAK0559103.1 hypothetical protein OC861_006746 [Tilletia horrida]